MKKLAFIINVFREDNFHSGGEKLYYELVKKALKKGFLVDLYCTKYLYDNETPTLKPQFNKIEVFGNAKDYKYPKKIELLYNQIESKLQLEEYEHIISENIVPPFDIGVLQGHSQKHYADMAGNFLSKILFKIKKYKVIKHQYKWLKKGFKQIIVPSETLKNELMDNFNLDKSIFTVAYPGVDMPVDDAKPDFQGILNDTKAVTFGISAPSFSKKGGFIFLKALNELKKQGYNFNAKIIYPKASKNLLILFYLKLFKLNNHIEFLSYQENMQNFYKSIDCIIMPSLLETFGLVALEGMAYGKIPVVSSYSGASEIIKEGQNGFIFDMKNKAHKNLAQTLIFILKNKDTIPKISEKAINTAEQYSWNQSTDIFFDNIK